MWLYWLYRTLSKIVSQFHSIAANCSKNPSKTTLNVFPIESRWLRHFVREDQLFSNRFFHFSRLTCAQRSESKSRSNFPVAWATALHISNFVLSTESIEEVQLDINYLIARQKTGFIFHIKWRNSDLFLVKKLLTVNFLFCCKNSGKFFNFDNRSQACTVFKCSSSSESSKSYFTHLTFI